MSDPTSAFPSEPEVTFRLATRDDVPDIVRMLADDPLGAQRETYGPSLPQSYYAAFEIIDGDVNNELVVGCLAGRVTAVLQLTFIPYLTHRGSWRALIEGVRIDSSARSRGIGRQLILWAVERARQRDCRIVQLTSDKTRADAIRFYESLGFVASHEGFKLHLASSPDAEP